MKLSELAYLLSWDLKVNRGLSLDHIRAQLLLIEVRIEQYVYRHTHLRRSAARTLLWYLFRFPGSLFQWFLCHSNIPGSATIGPGLRLPHPQNIILAAFADIGSFCTIYHNVSLAWNGFNPTVVGLPKVGNRVLIGAGAIVLGQTTIGDDTLIGAGTVVTKPVPERSRVTGVQPKVVPRAPSPSAAQPGSARHLVDPYSIWR
jgi:serine O-acetyltransferase